MLVHAFFTIAVAAMLASWGLSRAQFNTLSGMAKGKGFSSLDEAYRQWCEEVGRVTDDEPTNDDYEPLRDWLRSKGTPGGHTRRHELPAGYSRAAVIEAERIARLIELRHIFWKEHPGEPLPDDLKTPDDIYREQHPRIPPPKVGDRRWIRVGGEWRNIVMREPGAPWSSMADVYNAAPAKPELTVTPEMVQRYKDAIAEGASHEQARIYAKGGESIKSPPCC